MCHLVTLERSGPPAQASSLSTLENGYMVSLPGIAGSSSTVNLGIGRKACSPLLVPGGRPPRAVYTAV